MKKGELTKSQKRTALKVLTVFKEEHKSRWYDFMKGMLWGYMHDVPKYHEASVVDFEEWLVDLDN